MKPTVNIIGCGVGNPDLLPYLPLLSEVDTIVLRTERHPGLRDAFGVGAPIISCDDLYDTSETYEEVYERTVQRIVDLALASSGSLAYVVPGSPTTAEQTVRMLVQRPEITVRIIPRPGIIEAVLARLEVDPLDGFSVWDVNELLEHGIPQVGGTAIVLQAHSPSLVQEIALLADSDDLSVTLLYHLDLPEEFVGLISYGDPAIKNADHLTTLALGGLSHNNPLNKVRSTVRMLRTACPWDAKQTHASLSRHLLEEAHEVVEAIDELDAQGDEHLAEELGDVLLQVLMHATIANERGAFDLDEVASGLDAKLIARHPHVFGNVVAHDAATVVANWEEIKTREKGRTSILEGIPASLPEPLRLQKLLRKAQGLQLGNEDIADTARTTAKTTQEQEALRGVLSLCTDGEDVNALLRRFNTALAQRIRERETRGAHS